MRGRISAPSALVLMLRYDLRETVRAVPVVTLGALAMVSFVLIPLAVVTAWTVQQEPVRTHVLVVVTDPEVESTVRAWERVGTRFQTTWTPQQPDDPQATLRSERFDVVVTLPDDYLRDGTTYVGSAPGLADERERVAWEFAEAWRAHEVERDLGPDAPVRVLPRPEAAPSPLERAKSALIEAVGDMLSVVMLLPLFLIAMIGGGLGAALAQPGSRAAGRLYALSGHARTAYVAKMITLAVAATGGSIVLTMVVGGGLLWAVPSLPVPLAPIVALVPAAMLVIVQVGGGTTVLARAVQALPPAARGIAPVASVVLIYGIALPMAERFDDVVTVGPLSLVPGAMLPGAGPFVLVASPTAPTLAWAVQLGWTVLAVRLGTWAYVTDDPPQEELRRAWHRWRAR